MYIILLQDIMQLSRFFSSGKCRGIGKLVYSTQRQHAAVDVALLGNKLLIKQIFGILPCNIAFGFERRWATQCILDT